jgi:hypothetical protein
MNKCSLHALGVAIGVLWAVYVLFCGITAMFGWGVAIVDVISSHFTSATVLQFQGPLSVLSGVSLMVILQVL